MANTDFTPDAGALTATGVTVSVLAVSIVPLVGHMALTSQSVLAPSINGQVNEVPFYSAVTARSVGHRKYMIGFPKHSSGAVTVNPDEIEPGAIGTVDVTVTGVYQNRQYRVVMVPPATLEATLTLLDTPIVGTNLVRVRLKNTDAIAVNGASRSWTAHVFSKVP